MEEKIEINGVTYIQEKENHTLADLEQKLIDDLYQGNYINNSKIDILEILLKNKKD